jgi:hypothetical protein
MHALQCTQLGNPTPKLLLFQNPMLLADQQHCGRAESHNALIKQTMVCYNSVM